MPARASARLADRVARGLEPAGGELLVLGEPELLLRQARVLAGDGVDGEAVGAQHAADDPGLVPQPDTEGDAEAGEAAATGEVHDLLEAGKPAVAVSFDARRVAGQGPVLPSSVQREGLFRVGLQGRAARGVRRRVAGVAGQTGALGTGEHLTPLVGPAAAGRAPTQ